MSDDPSNKELAKTAAASSLTWLTLAVNALSLFEKLLPAFLVAWNNSLQQKNKELTLKLEKAQLDAKLLVFKDLEERENAQKNPADVIDQFLGDKSGDGSTDK